MYLGEVTTVFVGVEKSLQLVKGSACAGLHGSPDGSLGWFVHSLGLLVDNREALLVRSVDNADALAVNETGVTVAAQVRQIVGLLKY